MIVRGLLAVEAERIGIGDLVGELSRYEEQVDTWLSEADDGPAPVWQPTAEAFDAGEEGA